MVSEQEVVRVLEEYKDLAYGQQIEARINDADIPVGAIGTVLRRVEVTGNWQCVFDIDGRRRVVALCGDQLRPVGQVNHDPVLRLVAAAHDPVQYDDQTQQEINKQSVQRLTTEEAKQRRADGLRRYHERRKAEKEAAEAEKLAAPEPTEDEIEAMRTAHPVPRTIKATRADAPDQQDQLAERRARQSESMRKYHVRKANEEMAARGVGFAAAFMTTANEPAQDRDWLKEGAWAIRRVIASAAVSANARELELLVETALYLERGGAA